MARRAAIVLCCMLALAALVLIYNNDPQETAWAPKCPVWLLTGRYCPSCGMHRFVYHLLHGDVLTAVRSNYMAAPMLLYGLLVCVAGVWPLSRVGSWSSRTLCTRPAIYTFLFLYFAWGVLRNVWL